jgi:hypothetical protein
MLKYRFDSMNLKSQGNERERKGGRAQGTKKEE